MASWRETCITKGATVLWTFGPGSGNITDEIAGLVLTPTGAPTYGVTGPFPGRTAITFPTSGDFFTSPDNDLLDLVAGTVVAVVRRNTDLGTYQGMFNKGTNGHVGGWTNLDKWQLGKTGVTSLATESGTNTLGAWNCYGFSHTGVASGYKVYKDGTDVTAGVSSALLVATASVLEVGREGAGGRSAGSIAGLAYFPTVLSAADQLAISNAVGNADGGGAAVNASAGLASGGVSITAAKQGLVLAAGVATGSPIAYLATPTSVSGSLPIGGDESLRGAKPYTLPLATIVAAPYGLTQVNAAKVAAGVNGVVRFPAIGSPYAFATTMDWAGQTWQLESATTQMNGFDVTANGCTFEGGQVNGDIALRRTGNGHNFTLRNVKRQGGNYGIVNESRSGMSIKNCEFYGQALDFGKTWYDNAADSNVDGQTWENCIGIRTLGAAQDMIAGNDGAGSHTMKNFKVTNCRFDGGTNAEGHFGIEVWNNKPNAQGRGGIVEYSDLRGGDCLISLVGVNGSVNNWIHHNLGDLTTAYSFSETGGVNATGWTYEFNQVIGTGGTSGTRRGWFVYHDGAFNCIVRNNKVTGLEYLVGGYAGQGGNYTVTDNCVINSGVVLPGISNTQSNNGVNGCSY